ncbi:MAG: aminopeptidase P family protein [Chlamydiales bacterium]|nr:aminopeptidase P family protein [Chlamydiales bacterium]
MASINYSSRIKKASSLLARSKIDLLWIEDVKDIYYFTGASVSRGMLFILQEDAYLAVDGRYYEQVKSSVGLPVILDQKDGAYNILYGFPIKNIGVDFQTITIQRFEKMKQLFAACFVDVGIARQLRMIKDSQEITYLKDSAALIWEGYQHILPLIETNQTESFIAWQLEKFVREKGASELAFEPIIAFGKNSAFPHYRAGSGILDNHDCALIDIGLKKHQYCSDMTRTILLKNASAKLKEINSIVLESYEKAVQACKIGVPVRDIDAAARECIKGYGYGDFFPHSLGHGIGLDAHEAPLLSFRSDASVVMEENMVFTIEPGIYLPGIGGIRFENTLVMTKAGPISFFPHDND